MIVHADDLGLSAGVNRGIISCHAGGIVTSASLIANLPAFHDAVANLEAHPNLDAGVHLNLTCGRPVAPSSLKSPLTGAGGSFGSLFALLFNVGWRRVRKEHIETEFCAQIERALHAGVEVTHLDTHQNIHLMPLIRESVYSTAARFGIRWIRFREQSPLFIRTGSMRDWAVTAIARAGVSPKAARLRSEHGRAVIGAPQLRGMALRHILSAILALEWDGALELVCHPGLVDGELEQLDAYTKPREDEMTILQDPGIKVMLEQAQVTLCNYRSLENGPKDSRG